MTRAKRPRRPHRQRKGDRLLNPDARKSEIECDYAVAPMDRLAIKMDEKWGIDRLPELVSPETAQRYGSAMARLNAALEDGDPKEVLHRAQVVMRGLASMDREAEAAGQPKASADYFETEIDGFRFAVLKDSGSWKAFKKERPDLEFFTMREIAVALKSLSLDSPMFKSVKANFPQAELLSISERSTGKVLDDPLPF